MRINIKKSAIIIMILVFMTLFSSVVNGEKKLTVDRVSQIICFSENYFNVNAPEPGSLTITISTNTSVYRTIETKVEAGKNKIEWDGLGFNQEKLYPMNYHIDAELTGETGNQYHERFDAPVERSAQALTLALPSSEKLYLNSPKDWFLECKVIYEGTIVIEMIPEGRTDAVYTFRVPAETGIINHLTFSDIAGKTQINPGRYTMKIYEMSAPAFFKEMNISAEEDKPESQPVSLTGRIMPEDGDSDEEIWKLMTQPAVVVDIKNTNHQIVYEYPDEKSASLGTLHGQTQTLCVNEIRDNWALIEAWNHEEGERVTGWVPLENLKVEYPNTEYGLLVNKKEQTITVFQQGKRIETILVCTGRMEKDQLYQETAAGSFLTGEHRADYSMNGNRYDFVIQYDGGNLIHQIPYTFGEMKKDFTEGRALLGAKASHACIRVQAEPGPETGINAYWIWTHIPYHTRVIILDDPEERHSMKSILNGNADDENIKVQTYSVEDEDDSVILTFGGDAVLGGREAYYFRDDSLMAYIEKEGMSYPFSGLREYFATDDLTCINLECVLKADKSGERTDKEWRFRGLPEYTGILTEGSVEMVNIANNHTIDYGDAGYASTIEAIDGIVYWCGRNHPEAVEIGGHKFGFGGCRETTYKNDPGVISRDIQALKDMGCECIIYQCHWGKEYSMHYNALQQSMAHACVRAGADLVIGHHPHVVQGIDYIEGVPIIYSLGNLCFGGTIPLSGYDAILARVKVSFGEGHPDISLRIIPIQTSSRSSENINDFHPVPATGLDARRILHNVQLDSGVPVQ